MKFLSSRVVAPIIAALVTLGVNPALVRAEQAAHPQDNQSAERDELRRQFQELQEQRDREMAELKEEHQRIEQEFREKAQALKQKAGGEDGRNDKNAAKGDADGKRKDKEAKKAERAARKADKQKA